MKLTTALLFIGAAPAFSQTVPTDETHTLPFGQDPHVIELAIDVLGGTGGEASPQYQVAVVSGPEWVQFDSPATETSPDGDGGPVARVPFTVSLDAPVEEPFEVTLGVSDALGTPLATKSVWLSVAAPTSSSVGTPYPNPARSTVSLPYQLASASDVRVSVYDVRGRRVYSFVVAAKAPGAFQAHVDTSGMASGTYILEVRVGDGGGEVVEHRRVSVVR